MVSGTRRLCVAFLVVSALTAAACGGAPGDGTKDGTVAEYASIAVEPAAATLSVRLGETMTQEYQAFGVADDGTRTAITTHCSFVMQDPFGSFAAATATVGTFGGKATVTAVCGEQQGQAQLIINLTGIVLAGNAPSNSSDLFGGATVGTDAARTPTIEYPIDGAVSPRNIPSIETQWTGGGGNDLYHLRIVSSYATVDLYTTTLEGLLASEQWQTLAGTAAGERLSFVVEALAQAAPASKFASAPVAIVMTHDNIDETAILYWASSQGNIMSQTFGEPDAPSLVKNDCTSCHSVNRSGNRVGYSRCVNDGSGNNCGGDFLAVGFLKFDPNTNAWEETVNANQRAILGSYTTFSPDGSVSMVTHRGGTLHLHDPDTGAELASNLDIATAGGTRSALMPDWSADGSKVVMASVPTPGYYIDLANGSIQTMTHTSTGTDHVFGTPTTIIPNPMTLANGTYTNFFFPSFSPDGALVVANAARTAWRNSTDARSTGSRLVLAESSGAWAVDLSALNGGNVDQSITWAHWAPTVTDEYYWVVFSSERDYGHRTTQGSSPASCKANGVKQCKQIWLAAIAKSKLSGMVDPSAAPMWLPGQSTAANNISPYWSRAAVLQ